VGLRGSMDDQGAHGEDACRGHEAIDWRDLQRQAMNRFVGQYAKGMSARQNPEGTALRRGIVEVQAESKDLVKRAGRAWA
jgi:hypothetical protein